MSVDGIWYVKLEDGDVERVTLDQLDEWFQSGRIDEKHMVLADGADQWMKLAELLGLSEEPSSADEAETAPATPVAVAAAAGMIMAVQAQETAPAIAVVAIAVTAAAVMATPVAVPYASAPAQAPGVATTVATLQGIPAVAPAPQVAVRPVAAQPTGYIPAAQAQRVAVPAAQARDRRPR